MAGLEAAEGVPMSFDVAEAPDGGLIVTVTGELDITNVGELDSAVAPALEPGPRRLVVDVHDLQFADSSAIALLVQWASAVEEIELRDAPPLLRRVIETMGLTQTLRVTP
jgi:anti-sigma B factor antagonist